MLSNTIRVLYNAPNNNKVIIVVVSTVITALIIDISLIKVYDLISIQSDPNLKTGVFIIISAICVVTQYLILEYIKDKSKELRSKEQLRLNVIYEMVRTAQYILLALLVFVTLQVVIASYYNVTVLIAAIAISYALSIILMGLFTQKFLSWFKSNRNSVVLLYGLSSATLVINSILTLILSSIILPTKPAEVAQHGSTFSAIIPNSTISILYSAYIISSIASFILMWSATAMLLRHYSHKFGSIKYWIIVSIPLAYFLSQFITLSLSLFVPLFKSDPVFYSILLTLIFVLTKPVGGILFGIAFWTIARSIHHSMMVRNYLIISGYGFVLLFISNQAIVLFSIPYPPFGLATISFMGLSSYLVLVGIYSSAISVAQDVKLRQSIRKLAIKESKLLDSIGTAHMEQEIQKKVITVIKEHQDILTEETGVQSSLTEDDIKTHLELVLREVKNKHEEL